MQQIIYLLNSLEVTDSSGTERTERGGVSKSGFNHSESCKTSLNYLTFINMEPATDERRNQTRNRKLTALGALNRLSICSWTHVNRLFVWPLWYLAMSWVCSAQLPSPALLTNLSTQLWFYTNFRHHITFEVSAQINLPNQVNEFKGWGDNKKKRTITIVFMGNQALKQQQKNHT